MCPGAFEILVLFNEPLSEGHCKSGAHDYDGKPGTKLTGKIHTFFVVGFEREIACTIQGDIAPNVLGSEELLELTKILNTIFIERLIKNISKEDMYPSIYSKNRTFCSGHLRYELALHQSSFLCPTN